MWAKYAIGETATPILDCNRLVVASSRSRVQHGPAGLSRRRNSRIQISRRTSTTTCALQDIQSTLTSISVLAGVVTFHELGHFTAARSLGIHISNFSVGFGPKLLRWQESKEDTGVEYTLRLFPLGGYVGFPDDDPNCPYPEDDPNLFRNRPPFDRAVVASAGILANIVFAFSVLFAQVTTVGYSELVPSPGVLIPEVNREEAGFRNGLRTGDVILAINGENLGGGKRSVDKVVREIKGTRQNSQLVLTIAREGADPFPLKIRPDITPNGAGRLGVQLTSYGESRQRIAHSLPEALGLTTEETVRLTNEITRGLVVLLQRLGGADTSGSALGEVSGPVAIVAVGAQVASGGDFGALCHFTSLLNLNLAVVNLLPFPALDGGFLALIAVEAVRGRKLPQNVEKEILSYGLLLLLFSGMALILHDTLNLAFVRSLIK